MFVRPTTSRSSATRTSEVLLDDLAALDQKAVKAFYAAGCRYLQLDDTSWGEFCSAEKRKAYAERGIDVDEVGRQVCLRARTRSSKQAGDMVITMHICRGNFRSTWSSTGGYEPVAEILFGHCNVDGFFLEYDSDRAGGFEPLRYIGKQKVVLGLVTSKDAKLETRKTLSRVSARLPNMCRSSSWRSAAVRLRFHRGRQPCHRCGSVEQAGARQGDAEEVWAD